MYPSKAPVVAKNSLYASGGWLITALVGFAATPYLVCQLTNEGYGAYLLITGLAGYYGVLDLGFGQGIVKFVAQFESARDWAAMSASINAALILQATVGVIGSGTLVLFADPILDLFRICDEFHGAAQTSLYVASGVFLIGLLAATMNSVLAGLQRYRVASVLGNGSMIAATILSVVALMAGGGLVACVAVNGASSIGLFVLATWQVRKSIKGWRFSPWIDWPVVRSVFSFSLYIFVTKISDSINNYVGRFLVGAFLGPTAVTFYMVPARVVNAVWGILGSGIGVLVPFASAVYASADRASAQRLCERSSRAFAAIALPLFSSIALMSPLLLRVWMGEAFARHAQGVLTLMGISGIMAAVSSVPIQLALGFGHSRIVALFGILALVVYVSILVIAVPSHGVTGAATALVVAAVPGFALAAAVVRRIFGISPARYIWSVYKWHVSGVGATLAVCSLRAWQSGLSVEVDAGLSVLVMLGYTALILMKQQLPLEILQSVVSAGTQRSGQGERA